MAPAAALDAWAEAIRQLGLDPDHVLRDAGVANTLSSPRLSEVSASLLADLLHAAARITEREDFALLVTQAWRSPVFGVRGAGVFQQPTLAQGLTLYQERLKDWNGPISVAIDRRADQVTVRPIISDPALREDQMTVDLAMGLGLRSLRWMFGETWWPDRTCFARPTPASPWAHKHLFGQVAFRQGFDGFVIEADQLDRPILTVDPVVIRLIDRYALASAVHAQSSATEQICELIARALPTGDCSVDVIAQRLGVDRRTIHRHLSAEGCSFTDLVDRVRRELLEGQAASASRPLRAVAALLGFSSLSTFSRWHRAAFGVSARDARRASLRS